MAFSPNGKQIASGYSNGTIKLWDAATGNLQMTLEGHFEVTAVTFSRDGKQIASGSIDCNIKLWDAMPDELFKLWDSHRLMADPLEEDVASVSCTGSLCVSLAEYAHIGIDLDGVPCSVPYPDTRNRALNRSTPLGYPHF